MKSAVYTGSVRHRRFSPVEHAFDYTIFMMYLDLDELPTLFDGRWLWSNEGRTPANFRRAEHHGDPAVPLAESIRALVAERKGRRPEGPIRLLTHMRYFGHGFNPVSFYYIFDKDDARLETIVAEVSNTPWGERHCYVFDDGDNEGDEEHRRFRFAKEFHVSPFMQMDLDLDWRFSPPGRKLNVHMENWKKGGRFFDATMTLSRREIDGPALARTLAQYPLMTVRVVLGIYWQALRLWLKRAEFYTHPKALAAEKEASRKR